MATNVPSIQFTDAGLVLPAESAILAGVQADQNAAFGGGLNPALETPQGQLASSTTAIIGEKNNEFAFYVNQVDPDFASGRMQDAIARIYFIDRKPATPTAVVATCVGLAGVVIPVGATAKAGDGNLYTCTEAGTIPVGGSIDLNFACAVTGPIACPAGSLNQIYQSIPGWDTINNAADGTVGSSYNGNTSFTVTDTSGYDFPYPSYVVTWETPSALPILFAVQIASNPSLPANIVSLVQQAIIASFNGTDGGTRARIGSTIFASRFYGNIVALGPTVSILSLLLGPTTPTLSSYTVPINNAPTISAANISVTLV
jgi:hypothetical protein